MEEPGKECLVCLSVQEVTRWVNQYLSLGGYSSQLVTDLAEDMADGITLLRLVQAIGERWEESGRGGGRNLSIPENCVLLLLFPYFLLHILSLSPSLPLSLPPSPSLSSAVQPKSLFQSTSPTPCCGSRNWKTFGCVCRSSNTRESHSPTCMLKVSNTNAGLPTHTSHPPPPLTLTHTPSHPSPPHHLTPHPLTLTHALSRHSQWEPQIHLGHVPLIETLLHWRLLPQEQWSLREPTRRPPLL